MKISQLKPAWVNDVLRLIRNRRWEHNEDGNVLVGTMRFAGLHTHFAPDGLGWQEDKNLLTTEGLTHVLSVTVAGGSQNTTWYVAPYSGNISPTASWTAANFTATATEITGYSESTRIAFNESAPAAGVTNNYSNPAVITATGALSIWGAGILSVSTKSATSGVLLSAAKYAAVRSLAESGDTFGIKYQITATDV